MLPCNFRTRTRGQTLLAMISILAVLDVTTASTTASTTATTRTTETVAVDAVTTHRLPGATSASVTVLNSIFTQSSAAPPMTTRPTAHSRTVSEPTSTTLFETNEPINRNSTQTQVPQETSTTLASEMTDSRELVSQGTENTTFTKTEPTTQTVQSPNSATVPQTTSLRMEVLSSQTTAAPGSITCLGLGSFTSTSQVACFQFEEEITCDTLDKKNKEELRSFLCEIINTTPCNVTIHSSEVQPKCILWVPTSKDAEDRLQNETYAAYNPLPTQIKWGQVSDHQTRSQKTMIALVTCGVLLAAFILAGYFLSNRESWSPGRQRLGEDPYCTETDSQGNTLVSVSAHAQEKPNSGTRENGSGQTVSPTATNGHSTKKQTVSDTEL